MSQDDIAEARRSSESWYWWGIATFFRCPLAETPGEVDIGLVGVRTVREMARRSATSISGHARSGTCRATIVARTESMAFHHGISPRSAISVTCPYLKP